MKLARLCCLCACLPGVHAQAAPPKINVIQTNRAVCAYLGPILGQPCRQAVLVAIRTSDSAPEAFKVTLTYRDATGALKTDARIAMPTKGSATVDASVTFFLDDITVVSAVVMPMVSIGAVMRFPED